MIDINGLSLIKAKYKMPYYELLDIVAFVLKHEWEDIPKTIKEHLKKWQDFLVKNL